MRSNLPVTQREYAFGADQTLVSVTDLKGRITYCNAAFITVSGFSEDELLGQPHNVVRHPDMPEEAFRDLWQTIQSGLPWTGLVKNRRKNGDHYWVCANATPMRDGERIVGYLSVRTRPERAAVEQADAQYAQMRREATHGRLVHVLQRGIVQRNDWRGRLQRAARPGLAGTVYASLALATGIAAAAGTLGPWWAAAAALGAAGIATAATLHLTLAPLRGVLRDANRLASGDLSHPVDTGASGVVGELQRALMQLAVNLRTVVTDSRAGIEGVHTAAREIAAGNQDLSARTESQAGSLQQTAASMEEINTTATNAADSAAQGARMAQETASIARQSHEAVEALAATIEEITASSRRIEDIIAVVEGVSFQTNLLALNAAVEAARAGDAGRGFAVVASEVRALAQRTATAAREIRGLISTSAQQVAASSACSRGARERMHEALQSVAQVNATLEAIRTSATEQRAGIGQINEAVSHMDTITQQNAAMVEELAASAQAMQLQVDTVSGSMRLFRLHTGDKTVAELDAVQLRREQRNAAPAH